MWPTSDSVSTSCLTVGTLIDGSHFRKIPPVRILDCETLRVRNEPDTYEAYVVNQRGKQPSRAYMKYLFR